METKMTEKIYIGIDNERIEAKGEVLDQILKDRTEFEESSALIEADKLAKEAAKAKFKAALTGLGLTEEEAVILLG